MTSTELPDVLGAEVVSPGIDPAATGRLARTFHRTLAGRLADRLHGTAETALDVNRLTPRSVWLATAVAPDRDLTAEEAGWVERDLAVAGPALRPPPLDLPDDRTADAWHRDTVAGVQAKMRDVNDESTLRLSRRPRADMQARMADALGVLASVWPEAAVEFDLLTRSVVLLENTELSASQDQTFGVIFASVDYLRTTPGTVEVLLHETGHHSLFLRQAFAAYVTNPDDVVSHPLRPDPRPISGTVHAGHVLYRMAEGMRRWSEQPGPTDPEVLQRRDNAVTKLLATMDVLDVRARWTPAGATWFADLQASADRLRAAVAA